MGLSTFKSDYFRGPIQKAKGLPMKHLALVVMASIGLTCSGAAWAEKRVALVVGNARYTSTTPLRTPANDATDLANALERLGFDVLRGIDLDYAGMRDMVKRFSERLSQADVGLFYYGGHGLQVSGKNYLIPVDAKLTASSDLDFVAMELDVVLRNMEQGPPTNIVFLDACRNNPLAANLAKSMGTRSGAITRGLARVELGVGTLIAFATQPGNVALDGDGRNSPFAGALLKAIEQPGLPISDVMISVRREVIRETGNRQVPWDNSSLTGQFYFIPPPASPSPPAVKATPLEQPNFELDFWDSIKNEKNPRLFEAYLNRYPNGAFADLARIRLENLKTAALHPAAGQEGDNTALSDPSLLREVRERLYELNFDPGPVTGPIGKPARQAIREFQQLSKLPPTGEASQGLLRRLREAGPLKPWGAIAYPRKDEKWSRSWGMSWFQGTRQAAVASAREKCGTPERCPQETSFYGTDCGVLVAHSNSAWYAHASPSMQQAKEKARLDCRKGGRSCRIVATVCADGTELYESHDKE